MHGWTTGEQPHPLPSPDCDGSPGPPAGFSHCCEADRHWRGPPTPNSSSRESACLEQMPRSFGPSADAVDDECRCDALPHSWGSAWTPVETAQAQDGLCHGPLGLQRHPPAHLWRTFSLAHRPALGARVPTAEPLPEGRCVAGTGSGDHRRQVPCAQPIVGLVHPGQGLLVGPCASPHGHYQLAVSGPGGLIPPVARCTPCMLGAAFVLFFTPLHWSSHAKAMGRRARTGCACKRAACRPETRNRRAPVA
jgi:hypothetical protein